MNSQDLKRATQRSLDDLRAEQRLWVRDQQWCRCQRVVEGPRYMKQRSCRVCGKFVR